MRTRIRRTTEMPHVVLVAERPAGPRYIPLRTMLAACPAAKTNRTRYKNLIHWLVERGALRVVARPGRERARRFYDRDEIPFVRAVLQMHAHGLTLGKAIELARQRHRHADDPQARLF